MSAYDLQQIRLQSHKENLGTVPIGDDLILEVRDITQDLFSVPEDKIIRYNIFAPVDGGDKPVSSNEGSDKPLFGGPFNDVHDLYMWKDRDILHADKEKDKQGFYDVDGNNIFVKTFRNPSHLFVLNDELYIGVERNSKTTFIREGGWPFSGYAEVYAKDFRPHLCIMKLFEQYKNVFDAVKSRLCSMPLDVEQHDEVLSAMSKTIETVMKRHEGDREEQRIEIGKVLSTLERKVMYEPESFMEEVLAA